MVCDRVARPKSSNRRRSTTVRPVRPALRIRRVIRSTRLTTTASTSAADIVLPRLPSARCAPTERRRTPVTTRRRSMLRDNANSRYPIAPPTSEASVDSESSATSATVSMPCACSFSAVFTPTPHSRRTGSGCRNASSRSGGTSSSPSGLASWLATLARNLVRAMPTVMGSPTRSRTFARSCAPISTGVPDTRARPDTSRNASSTDSGSTIGAGVVEHLEHRVAGRRVRRHPRRHHDRVRTQRPGLAAAHRGAHPVGLGLVAGGEHHASADEHGTSAQRRIVTLLHRRVERIEVGVQDRGARTRTYVRIAIRHLQVLFVV